MKNQHIIFFFTLISCLSIAQESKQAVELDSINHNKVSEDCKNVFKSIGLAQFPTSLGAQHTVIRDGACSVTLQFSVLEAGTLEFVKVKAIDDRCKVFSASALAALKKSVFHKQPLKRLCEHTYRYEIQPDISEEG